MSNPNPIIPPDSPLQRVMPAKNSSLFVAVFAVVTVHVVFLAGLLIQGCKRQDQAPTMAEATAANLDVTAATDRAKTPPEHPAAAPSSALGTASRQVDVSMASPAPTRPDTHTVLAPAPESRDITLKVPAPVPSHPDSSLARAPGKTQSAIPPEPGLHNGTPATGSQPAPSATSTYVVKPGDSLTKIARSHGTTVSAIRAASGLKTDRILVGQKLKIPETKPSTLDSAAVGPTRSL